VDNSFRRTKEGSNDPMRFGYHCSLLEAYTDYIRKTPEDFFEWYLEGTLEKNLGISKKLIVRWEMDNPKLFVEDLEWFVSTIQKSVFKRVQSPPIIITSRSSYGYDIRESILPVETSARYRSLKSEILKMSDYISAE
jgi:NAD+ synthase (glutamine-hydrolysing)